MEHASAFLELVFNAFMPEKLYWRTNPNCPLRTVDKFRVIDLASESQAESVRKACRAREGIWSKVTLIDWRKHFLAEENDCASVTHYKARGYESLVDLIGKASDEE